MILSFNFQSFRIFVEYMFLNSISWYTHFYHSRPFSFSFLPISSHMYVFSFCFCSSSLDQGLSVKPRGSSNNWSLENSSIWTKLNEVTPLFSESTFWQSGLDSWTVPHEWLNVERVCREPAQHRQSWQLWVHDDLVSIMYREWILAALLNIFQPLHYFHLVCKFLWFSARVI